MSAIKIKQKIQERLDAMSKEQLQSAYFILKEVSNQQSVTKININSTNLDKKIATGIEQLNQNKGTDFGQFVNEMQVRYGNKS